MEFKSASEVLDYEHDLSAELGTDTITASSWVVDSGITVVSSTNTTTTGTVWISGGTAGNTYKIISTITTAAGRTHVKEFYLRVQEQRAG